MKFSATGFLAILAVLILALNAYAQGTISETLDSPDYTNTQPADGGDVSTPVRFYGFVSYSASTKEFAEAGMQSFMLERIATARQVTQNRFEQDGHFVSGIQEDVAFNPPPATYDAMTGKWTVEQTDFDVIFTVTYTPAGGTVFF